MPIFLDEHPDGELYVVEDERDRDEPILRRFWWPTDVLYATAVRNIGEPLKNVRLGRHHALESQTDWGTPVWTWLTRHDQIPGAYLLVRMVGMSLPSYSLIRLAEGGATTIRHQEQFAIPCPKVRKIRGELPEVRYMEYAWQKHTRKGWKVIG